MAPPTGASDSIIVVRRNGPLFEPYYGALSSPAKSFPMEGSERFRKTWGERWKVNKSGKRPGENQMIESSNFMVHPDYLHKYGTLSNGILTKSIKHADTWLYGTVGVRGGPTQRPSLFLYPGVVAPAPRIVNQSTYITSPGAFLTPSPQNRPSERNGYMITQPRKQNDQRFSSKQNEFNFHECSDCRHSIRSGACLSCKKTDDKRNGTFKGTINKIRPSLRDSAQSRDKRSSSNSQTDPYNLMRKNRLAINEGTEHSNVGTGTELSKKKTKITGRSSVRGQSLESVTCRLETFKPKGFEKEVTRWPSGEEEWHNEEEVIRRKSILECDLNVYELNKSTKKLGNDEDSSDEFTEATSKVGSKLKILRPKLSKTEMRKSGVRKSDPEKTKSQNENVKNSEVRLNGQKFKIFDHSSPSTSLVEGYLSDDNDNKKMDEATMPRLTSPKRPPRRPKDKVLGEISFRHSKSKSKSSPNLSIKSILKKPTGIEEFGAIDLSVYREETEGKIWNKPQTTEFAQKSDLTIKKQTQNTIKKKKQVQFRVNNSFESLNKITQVSSATSETEIPVENVDPNKLMETESIQEPVQRSKSCENLSFVSETVNECLTTDKIKSEEEKSSEEKECTTNGQSTFSASDEILNEMSTLRRSQSERHLSSARLSYKDDLFSLRSGPSNSVLFSDTMALRTRIAKQDARKILFGENQTIEGHCKTEEKLEQKDLPLEQLISARKSDGEAQNTSQNLEGNLISYAVFSDLEDTSQSKENGVLKRTPKKTRLSTDSYIPVKIKSAAPKPPSRRPSSSKPVKAKSPETISVTVPSKDNENALFYCTSGENFEKIDNSSDSIVCHEPVQTFPEIGMEATDGKIIVKLSHSQDEMKCKTSTVEDDGASKMIIQPKVVVGEPKNQPQRKTSILINNFHPQDTNKVTISVRNESSNDEPNSSSCTIIETGSNSTVIPVVSTDNKTTLIVGSSSSVTSSNVLDEVLLKLTPPQLRKDTTKTDATFPASQQGCISTNLKCDSSVEFLDPVEAVRRNLIPHVCGKEENDFSLLEKIKQLREAKTQKSLAQISQLFGNASGPEVQTSESSTASCAAKKCSWKSISSSSKSEEESSANTSRSNSFCSTINSSIKNSSTSTSRSSSFRSSCCKSIESDYDVNQILPSKSKFYFLSDAEDTNGLERDKLEYEYEVRNGFKEDKREDCENIYETIKEEPIYDQIGLKTDNEEELEDDIPPPLPLTLPPSLDEIDIRSPKSIFEGASKYDILNYLVDAKDRVQEECYFSGSSTSEDVDSRKLNSLEDSKKKNEVSSTELSSPEGLDLDDNAKRMDRCQSKFVEIDSGVDLSSPISNMNHIRGDSEDSSILSRVPEGESFKLSKRTSAEVERNDSGVGSETSHTSRSKWQVSSSIREDALHLCEDCDQVVETQVTDGGVMYAPLICRKCSKRRSERKEIIQEIVETEEKYGRDLKIILEEFYTPMLVAGLLTPDQLAAIFLNTEDLVENSEQLTEKLKDTLEIALEQGDEDLLTVNIGKLFLEAGPMLHAFESYCTRQGAAAVLLATLEKEKELLRIFLRVSQMENTVLRRMNLNSFLMVPVQRVTKYPLLLARLYKVTPPHLEGRELLKEAQHNIELHLEHMNSEAKDISTTKVWRRFSSSTASGRKTTAELEMINIKLRKMAVDILEWNHEEVRFVMEGKLLYTQPTDNNWKRGRTIKLTPIFVLLVTLGKPNSRYKMDPPENELTFPTKTGVREATLLLVKEKCGRYTLIREPLFLDKIIICCETDADEYFEIQELSTKDSFIFKAEDGEKTKEWYRHLQYHAQILGAWRKRRNALANIMINGMTARAYAS